ncbi:MAG TPA: hypothetical protein VFX79_00495 [Candidatus Saccharimonadales bacterium]|nr:hypothetical protein [Candidatus Saccharimonadales bacterium]
MSKKALFKTIIIAVVLAVLVGLGFILGKNNADNSQNNQAVGENSVYSNVFDLRKDFNIKLAEHVALTSEAMRVSYDEHDSSIAVIDELDKNSQQLAGIIGEFYGDEAEASFLKLWQDQVTFFINYTVSAKNNDTEGKEQALSDLENYSREAAEFLAGLNSNLSADSLKPLLTEHRDLMITSINEYMEAKYVEALDKESKAYEQAGKVADAISDGIVKQFPDEFNE